MSFKKIYSTLQKEQLLIPLILVSVTVFVFWQFFLLQKIPYPGNYLIAWYEPYRTMNYADGVIQLPHKPVIEDVFRHILPFRLLAIDMIGNGSLPLWNPYNGSGMPLFAMINSGFLDPFNVLFFILPDGIAWGSYIVFQFFLIAVTTYLYARIISLSKQAALFSALAFAFSGFVTVRLIFGMYGLTIAMLPFGLYLIEKYKNNSATKLIFLLPFVIALMILTSQPQVVMYILLIFLLYSVLRFYKNISLDIKKNKHLFVLTGMFILGLCLAAIQLLPTYELMKYAHINPQVSEEIIDRFLLPITHLISIPIPNYFGNASTYNYWGSGDYVQTVAHVGSIVTLLAAIGLFLSKTQKSIKFFAGSIIACTIFIAIDTPLSQFLYSLPIPLLSTGAPSRILFLTAFFLTILSGFGFDVLYSSIQKNNLKPLLGILLTVFLGVLTILGVTFALYYIGLECGVGIHDDCRKIAFRNTVLETGVFTSLSITLIAIFFNTGKKKHLLTFLFFGLFILTGMYNAQKFLPFSNTKDLFPGNSTVSALQHETKDKRVIGIGDAMIETDLATAFRIYDPQFYHPLYIYRYRELLDYVANGFYNSPLPRGDARLNLIYNENDGILTRRERLLNLDSVAYRLYKKQELTNPPHGENIWEDEDFLLIASSSALPRAYLVNSYQIQTEPEEILQTLYDPSFTFNTEVVLEESIGHSLSTANESGEVNVASYTENEVVLQGNSTSDSLLVLTDNYYPGWNAYVNGEKQKIYRANYTFRAVYLPEGDFKVIYKYEPLSFYYGAGISAVTLVAIAVLFFGRKRFTV